MAKYNITRRHSSDKFAYIQDTAANKADAQKKMRAAAKAEFATMHPNHISREDTSIIAYFGKSEAWQIGFFIEKQTAESSATMLADAPATDASAAMLADAPATDAPAATLADAPEINDTNPMIASAYKLALDALADAKKIQPKSQTDLLAYAINELEFDLAYTLQTDFSESGLEKSYNDWLASLATTRAHYARNPQIHFIDTTEDQRGLAIYAQKIIAQTLIYLATSASELKLEISAITGQLDESANPDDHQTDLIYEFLYIATDASAHEFEEIRTNELMIDYFTQTAEDLGRLAAKKSRNQESFNTMIYALAGWPA